MFDIHLSLSNLCCCKSTSSIGGRSNPENCDDTKSYRSFLKVNDENILEDTPFSAESLKLFISGLNNNKSTLDKLWN